MRLVAAGLVGLLATAASLPVTAYGPVPTPEATMPPAASPEVDVEPPIVWNDTSLTVTIRVNGTVLEAIPPGSQQALAVTGPPPWDIEVVAPDGFRLATGSITGAAPMGYRNDLSCGRIDILWRTIILGPMNGPGQPGDCGPGTAASSSMSPSSTPTAVGMASPAAGVTSAAEGGFTLTVTMPRTLWSAADTIAGTAELTSTMNGTAQVGGAPPDDDQGAGWPSL